MYLEVALNLPIDRIWTYSANSELEVKVGQRVLVPFGKRRLTGCVVNLIQETEGIKQEETAGYAIKEILNVLDSQPVFDSEMLKLTRWIAEYYLCSWGQVLECAFSSRNNTNTKGSPKRIKNKNQGIVFEQSFPLLPTQAQTEALISIIDYIKQGRFGVFLVHGITGSGKTEVYLQSINEILKMGKSAIVLVPEISLTHQTIERFKSRFQTQIAIFHSRLSSRERYDEWQRMYNGEARICIGARSAIFAPLKNLGLIVVDEEHENTYKQYDTNPRYNARDVAVVRAKFSEAVVILGSATPSLESYYNSKIGKYRYISLPERIDNSRLPEVKIIDMRDELKTKNYSIFSGLLKETIKERIKKNEQVIIFLNRRGFSTFVQCRECGFVLKCNNCEITLTYHIKDNSLRCHYCNYSQIAPAICPNCHGINIGYFGFGTQRVQEDLQRLFPEANICRMDLDTTTKKGSHQAILSSFKSGKFDIMIGTQMIAKGLDFPNVTLVGVVSADIGLNLPDFRATERTFSLLTQVAGRAGRGTIHGLVIIQTYNPEHYAILSASNHDYKSFYDKEIVFRQQLNYPPFFRLVNLTLKGKVEENVRRGIEEISVIIKGSEIAPFIILLGPAPCALSKIKGQYRWQILLKSKGSTSGNMRNLIKKSINKINQIRGLNIDIDPVGML